MKNELAPIVLFVYNRPDHTKKVLESLSLNKEARNSLLYIVCDGIKENSTEENTLNINEVRKIADEENRFQEVKVIKHSSNNGLAKSIIEGVTNLFNKHDRLIILEDDLVTSPYFLNYMNNSLNVYQDDTEVVCISGYVYPIKKKLPETYFIKGADCWGWATWKNKWSIFNKNGEDLLNKIETQGLQNDFDFDSSYPYTQMLKDQVLGYNNSWAIRWYASSFLKHKYCLYPGVSLVQNIGIDGSGTHSGISNSWDVNLSKTAINIVKQPAIENKLAKKQFIKYFNSLKKVNKNNGILNYIKNYIKSE
ncbi:glycosyltransferase [Vicingus serpentipes]|uniref:Glycosyltransferase n=1 Tax=Vicingus serpentipes TaxID=1926625 RepID=A0A5C6RTD4_9FLAO|nr:glycosyltransferase [Vicingus serpentipes]TXB65417.1 glycosyltransferase [Vicingus serpentipes]